jgi:hypothetical protein
VVLLLCRVVVCQSALGLGVACAREAPPFLQRALHSGVYCFVGAGPVRCWSQHRRACADIHANA